MDILNQMDSFLKKLNENDAQFKEDLKQAMISFKHEQQKLLEEEEKDKQNQMIISLYNETRNSITQCHLPMNNSYNNKETTFLLNNKKELIFNDCITYNEVA